MVVDIPYSNHMELNNYFGEKIKAKVYVNQEDLQLHSLNINFVCLFFINC